MRGPIVFLLALGAATLLLDAWAAWKVFTSSFYEPRQRRAQLALILLLPIAGAWLVLHMARADLPPIKSRPVNHRKHLDVTSNDLTPD